MGVDEYKTNEYTLSYPHSVPLSYICYEAEVDEECVANSDEPKVTEFQLRAMMLFEKYIKVGSEMEINISSSTRAYYMDRLQDINNWNNEWRDHSKDEKLRKLFDLFRPAMKEQIDLLQHSFARFKKSAIYSKIVSELTAEFQKQEYAE